MSTCRVERGLYALRYVEADSRPPPRADITLLAGDISLVSAPGSEEASLMTPGQALVVVAAERGEFEIKVSPVAGGGTDARFDLEMIDGGRSPSDATTNRLRPDPYAIPFRRPADPLHDRRRAGVSLIAHVSRRGDVSAGADEWIAGPDEILPIEGLSIATGRQDLQVRIRVQSARGDRQWSRWFEAEEFAGSRQQADPLTAVSLALTGDAAALFEIVAEVLPLGSSPQLKSGPMVEFKGFDPIVGFRFGLNPVNRSSAPPPARPASPLRVFRAKR